VIIQLVSLAGAILVLAAYMANTRRWLGTRDPLYNLMNLVGAGLLCWVALEQRSLGFVILEGTWALIAVPPLLNRRRAP
jgi:hypothetical protein